MSHNHNAHFSDLRHLREISAKVTLKSKTAASSYAASRPTSHVAQGIPSVETESNAPVLSEVPPTPKKPSSIAQISTHSPPSTQIPTTIPPPAEAQLDQPATVEADFGPSGWNTFLLSCVGYVGGECAFVMDEHGLIVAHQGELPEGDLEGIGARLMLMLEQATSMDENSGASVAVALGSKWLTGISGDHGGSKLTIGIIAETPANGSQQKAILKSLSGS